jgi:hypothetical protein
MQAQASNLFERLVVEQKSTEPELLLRAVGQIVVCGLEQRRAPSGLQNG